MNPELEMFLERAFEDVQPTSDTIGRVVVEPDYEAHLNEDDEENLAEELTDLLQHLSNNADLKPSPEGVGSDVPAEFGLLKKYVRHITLHSDSVEGSWVEVTPPGNWI